MRNGRDKVGWDAALIEGRGSISGLFVIGVQPASWSRVVVAVVVVDNVITSSIGSSSVTGIVWDRVLGCEFSD